MSDVDELIRRVLELDGKATKAPWKFSPKLGDIGGGYDSNGTHEICSHPTWVFPEAVSVDGANARLIVAYRTAAPLLARELEKCRSERDAMLAFSNRLIQEIEEEGYFNYARRLREELRAALADSDGGGE